MRESTPRSPLPGPLLAAAKPRALTLLLMILLPVHLLPPAHSALRVSQPGLRAAGEEAACLGARCCPCPRSHCTWCLHGPPLTRPRTTAESRQRSGPGSGAFLAFQSSDPGRGPVPAALRPCRVLWGRGWSHRQAPCLSSSLHIPSSQDSRTMCPALPPDPSGPLLVREVCPSSGSPGAGGMGGSRWDTSRSSLSPRRYLYPSAQARGARFKGSQGWTERAPFGHMNSRRNHAPSDVPDPGRGPERWQNPP